MHMLGCGTVMKFVLDEEFNSLCGSLRVLNSHVSFTLPVPHTCLQDQEQSPVLLLLQLKGEDLRRKLILYLTRQYKLGRRVR